MHLFRTNSLRGWPPTFLPRVQVADTDFENARELMASTVMESENPDEENE